MATPTVTQIDSTSVSEQPRVGAKSCEIKFKTDGLGEGEFIAYASVFGNKDIVGDIVVPGAFAKSLVEWEAKGTPIPLLWGHNTADPDFNIGEVLTAVEDDHGLKIHARLDMESPKAAQTYRLLKGGRVNQMSFAYEVKDGAYVSGKGAKDSGAYELRELDLWEVSIVPIGANQETEILAVKSVVGSLASKAGRVLSAKNETALRGALSQAKEMVAALESVLPAEADEEDQTETTGKEPPAADEKSSPVMATPSPSVSLAMTLIDIESQGDCEL